LFPDIPQIGSPLIFPGRSLWGRDNAPASVSLSRHLLRRCNKLCNSFSNQIRNQSLSRDASRLRAKDPVQNASPDQIIRDTTLILHFSIDNKTAASRRPSALLERYVRGPAGPGPAKGNPRSIYSLKRGRIQGNWSGGLCSLSLRLPSHNNAALPAQATGHNNRLYLIPDGFVATPSRSLSFPITGAPMP
jgi:hypothetical protein